jgi:hypothetical protein
MASAMRPSERTISRFTVERAHAARQHVRQLDEVGPQRHHGLEVGVAGADVVDGHAEAHRRVGGQGAPERRRSSRSPASR